MQINTTWSWLDDNIKSGFHSDMCCSPESGIEQSIPGCFHGQWISPMAGSSFIHIGNVCKSEFENCAKCPNNSYCNSFF